MKKTIKPSDIRDLANICKDIKKTLNFENPIIENKELSKKSKRFKTLLEYSIPADETRYSENKKPSDNIDKYEKIVFLQGKDASEILDILNQDGKDEAINYLMELHQPGKHEIVEQPGTGSSDKTYEKDGYILSWNSPLGNIGLSKKI